MSNQKLPLVSADPIDVAAPTPALPNWLPRPKLKAKRKRFNASLCWCGCGSKKNRKRKYASGHSAYTRYRFIFGSES